MKKVKTAVKFSWEVVLSVIYKVCRAFVIWYELEDDKKWYEAHPDSTDYMKVPK